MITTISFERNNDHLSNYVKVGRRTSENHFIQVDSALTINGYQPEMADIVVHNGDSMSLPSHSFNGFGQLVVNRTRHNKSEQAIIVNHAARHAEHFIPMASWSPTSVMGLPDDTKVVVKPENGARGLFQFVTTYRDLRKLVDKTSLKFTEEALKNEGLLVTKNGLRDGENIDQFANDSFRAWNYVENIAFEIRIITDAEGMPGFSHRRSLLDTEALVKPGEAYRQATGKYVDVKRPTLEETLGIAAEKLESEITDVLSRMHRPLHSFDIFVTNDLQWGIFEYCNEFGTSAIHSNWLKDETDRYLDLLCRTKEAYDKNAV